LGGFKEEGTVRRAFKTVLGGICSRGSTWHDEGGFETEEKKRIQTTPWKNPRGFKVQSGKKWEGG